MTVPDAKPDSTRMALDRTWLAHERTLMAWVRTAASMISFGFTIYKFFEFESGRNARVTQGLLTPRDFAVIMVSVGLFFLLIATLQHRRQTHLLRTQLASLPRSLAMVVAGIVSPFRILVLLSALFRS